MREIADSIIGGRYRSDEILPAEAALGGHFRVSRTIIRESMKRLEEKGLIAVQQGRGTLVRPASDWNVLDPLVLNTIIDHDANLNVLDELTQVRAALEGIIASQAATNMDEAQVKELEDSLKRMCNRVDDYPAFRDADAEFHRIVMRCSRNFLASNIANTLYSHGRSFARFEGRVSGDAIKRTVQQHRRIYDAISRRDESEASDAMSFHIRDAWQRRAHFVP